MEETRQVFKWFAFNDFHKEFLKRMENAEAGGNAAQRDIHATSKPPMAFYSAGKNCLSFAK